MARCERDELILGQEGQSPAVIVPLIGAGAEELGAQALAAGRFGDLVEWRVDAFGEPFDSQHLAHTAAMLREASRRPLIATVRTVHEGGGFEGDDEDYLRLVETLADSPAVNLVDVEAARSTARRCIVRAGEQGTAVIASHHDVTGTPEVGRMVDELAQLESTGAQFVKLAVMAHSAADTARLLLASAQHHEVAGVPFLTMTMGPAGLASRVVGHLFGSCATFASLGDLSSAPGQPSVEGLRAVLAEFARLGDNTLPSRELS